MTIVLSEYDSLFIYFELNSIHFSSLDYKSGPSKSLNIDLRTQRLYDYINNPKLHT